MAFVCTLIVYIGTGPNWYQVEANSHACRLVWWQHVIYANNLITRDLPEAVIYLIESAS